MAKITLGPIVTDIRNAQGGLVFARGNHGPYTRARVMPSQTLTPRRDAVRAAWTTAALAWKQNLTDQQRAHWLDQATLRAKGHRSLPCPQLMAFSWFTGRNAMLNLAGAPLLTDCPADDQVQQPTQISLACTQNPAQLLATFAPAPVPPAHVMLLWATKPMNTGRSFATDFRRWFAYRPAGTTSPTDITTDWVNRFGPSPTNKKLFLWAELLNLTNGARSQKLATSATTTQEVDNMYQVKTQITAAQILAMNVTPVIIVPAPPAGNQLTNINTTLAFHPKTTAYTVAPGSYINFTFASPTPIIASFCPQPGLLDQTAETTAQAWTDLPTPEPRSLVEAAPVALTLDHPATGGDGTLTVVTDFTIHPLD